MISLTMPNLSGNEKKYLNNCIDTTYVSSVGEYVTRFENMIMEATGSNYAVATSSGTTGLHAALTAIGVKHGDLVIIPSFTFIASANAVRHCGADPWLLDISREDWCLDPGLVRAEIEKKCKKNREGLIHQASGKRVAAIMPVYTLGNIPDMREMRLLADDYQVPLIVDAACAIGATYMSRNFGDLADMSILSFNGNKTITCGGGGAIIGNNAEMLEHVRHLTTTARVWPNYDFDEVGFNYRMTNIQAAVGCAQMERLDEFVSVKRHVRDYYMKALQAYKDQGISFFPGTEGSSCWFSGVVMPPGTVLEKVKEICDKLKKKGVEARQFWKPVHLQQPYLNCPRSDTSVSDSLWQRIITLPCSTNITDVELEAVVKAFAEVTSDISLSC